MDRETYIKQWEIKFKELEGRKPKHTERMAFKVGWNAKEHDVESEISDE